MLNKSTSYRVVHVTSKHNKHFSIIVYCNICDISVYPNLIKIRNCVTNCVLLAKKTIAESGKHNIFANGLSITNKDILDMKQWTGQSKLGEILMTVRRELPPKPDAV